MKPEPKAQPQAAGTDGAPVETPRPRAGERLVAALHRLVTTHDRGALAALRASAQDDRHAHLAFRFVLPHLPSRRSPELEAAALRVAGLFGLHPTPTRGYPLGRALRALATLTGGAGVERRLLILLGATSDVLADPLRLLVVQLRAHHIALDYVRLIEDLRSWDHPSGWVQRRIARDFWAPAPATAPTAPEGPTP